MIEYLNIEENQIPVRINRRAIILFEKQTKTGLANIGDMSTETLSRLLYIGACEGYRFLDQKNPFKTFEKFEDELDKMDVSDFFEQAGAVVGAFFSKGEGSGGELETADSSQPQADKDQAMILAFEAGLSLNEYLELTPLEFDCFVLGFEKRTKSKWELARFQSYFAIKPHLTKQYSNKAINQLIPFGWEAKKKGNNKKMSKAEFSKLSKKWGFV